MSYGIVLLYAAKVVLALAVVFLTAMVVAWSYKKLKDRVSTYYRLFKKWLMLKISVYVLHNNQVGYTDLIFKLFVSFYEREMKDTDIWELPVEFFPKGKAELSDMYKWIKKTREENFKELNNLVFDSYSRSFKYWRATYKTFKHKIVNGELHIEPTNDCMAANPDTLFKLKLMKAENELYDLDTTKVMWIIERRRFFNF